MKKINTKPRILLSLFLMLIGMGGGPLMAQQGGGQDVEAIKIAYITRRLELTAEEAKVFWPVYDAYKAEQAAIRSSMRDQVQDARGNFDNLPDAEMEKIVDNVVALKQQEADVTAKYHEEFKKVLPIRKVAQLYRAEIEFNRMILQGLRDRREQGGARPGGGPGGGPGRGRFR